VFVLYGGTFDPVHDGHLAIARAARDALQAEIRLMPAADPPHRPPPGAAASDRAAMLELAVAGEPGLRVDLRELRRDAPSWSVDTLRELRRDIGDARPVALLLGADSFAGLPAWKDWRALPGLAHFVVASRAGNPLDPGSLDPALAEAIEGRVVDEAAALRAAPAGAVLYLRQPLHPQSATAIRAAIAAGGAWRALVPPAVAGYIDRHGLYRR
jgi:nicotinate-nucleotide adenylyltransferase